MTLKISNYKLLHPTDKKILIDNFSLVADYGDIIGILGANGTGKTLFLDSIATLTPNWEGSITMDGKNLDLDFISYFVQDIQNSFLTETVENELKYHIQNIDTNISLKEIISNLSFFGINYNSIKELPASALSSNGNRILTFILSLLKPHKIRLLDELDSGMTLETKNILSQFLNNGKDHKITIIVSHDNLFLENLCSKIIRF
ncbi:MAG: ATP-binding cassette domain-containing protein [Candidatus Delongbacteria bacterium]|jgi:ABC-type multidrug transport system ATPase subunit|nr:ATP-binding cassette domain-containing protein [Candidatus Delongbacteria bacterium]